MKKIKNLPESSFLKVFFGFIIACFLIAAVCMPDRATMFTGLWQIMTSPTKLSTNFFSIGGFSATFLNMALVSLFTLLLYIITKATVNNVSTLAFLLTLGFSAWGINVVNMIPPMLGVMLYGLVKKEKLGGLVNAMLFSTAISPLVSEMFLRYAREAIGFNVPGVILGLAVGLIAGFFLPAGLPHSPKVHKGFDLYSAALPIGMTTLLLSATLYKTLGVEVPNAIGDAAVGNATVVNIFCGSVFGLCVIFALLLGCTPKAYWKLLTDPDQVTSFSGTYGNAVFLMNAGIFGLFILGYYNAIGANFNAITLGLVFCMVSCCNSGSHPGNVWPIMAGYVAASYLFAWLSTLVPGANFAQAINAPAIAVGLCFANGLSPIADKYGWFYGLVAAMFHYCIVTTIPSLHNGFCLYNGGLTAAILCLLIIPPMEKMFKTKEEKRALKAAK